jgi:hypothetical protein
LHAYHIEVIPETAATFFGNKNLPATTTSPAILAHETYPPAVLPNDADQLFFDYLKEAIMTPGEKSAITDFTAHLLHLLGYDEPDGIIFRRQYIPLLMCSTNTHAKADVCIIDMPLETSPIRLLVQVDKRKNPEPQLIAGAIASFQSRNHLLSAAGLPALNTAVIPGITMVGTTPTFYKIDLTTTVVDAIKHKEFPTQTTTVHKLTPPVEVPSKLRQEGMQPLNNRAIILSCFEAFKQFL